MATTLAVTLAAGVAFGLTLAAPPGPMNAIIAEESVLHGWGAGFRAGLGAAAADGVFFVLAALGVVGFVDEFPVVRGTMVGVGGLLMLYFAYGAATDAGLFAALRGRGEVSVGFFETDSADETGGASAEIETPSTETPATASETSTADAGGLVAGTGFQKAFVLALTNPYQVLFWLTVGVGLLDPGRIDVFAAAEVEALAGTLVVETGSPALIVGFFGGIGVWITGFPGALVTARRRVSALAPVVAVGSALVLAGFGVAFLADAAGTLGGVVG
ncbi:LysE family transporter [Halobaculum sp. MBLA0147]|uniref:LysE family transporter n=1 Tax=Halobaculum sp. MBLA0147 TaxID=3079934 RepID=UPI0035254D41